MEKSKQNNQKPRIMHLFNKINAKDNNQNEQGSRVLEQFLQTVKLRSGEFIQDFPQLISKNIKKEKWYIQAIIIDEGRQQKMEKWQNFLSKIIQSNVFILEVRHVKNSIINTLSEIRFTNLKVLKLQNYYLTNMELVTLFNVPQLKFLSISKNSLTNIKSLIKCFATNPVQLVTFTQNQIPSMSDRQLMRRINFSSKQNSSIKLFKFQSPNKNQQHILSDMPHQDPIFLIPFHLKKLRRIYISPRIMENQKLLKMMKNIFSLAEFSIVRQPQPWTDFFCAESEKKYQNQCLTQEKDWDSQNSDQI